MSSAAVESFAAILAAGGMGYALGLAFVMLVLVMRTRG